MSEKIIPVVISEEDFPKEYLRMTTFRQLTPLGYDVLAEICGYGTVGRREKTKIRNRLNMTVHSMNNVISTLKKGGYVTHNEADHTYTSTIEIPTDLTKLTFQLEIV